MKTVNFHVDSDEDATRVATVLEALGYAAVRMLQGTDQRSMKWSVERVARRHKLTEREAEVLDLAIGQGLPSAKVSEALGISKATVKWHMHNIFAKTDTLTREDLLRFLLKTQTEVGKS